MFEFLFHLLPLYNLTFSKHWGVCVYVCVHDTHIRKLQVDRDIHLKLKNNTGAKSFQSQSGTQVSYATFHKAP